MIKNLTAAFVLMASLGISTSAQVKSVAAANNHTSAKSSAPVQSPSNTTRLRTVGQDSKAGANVVRVVTPQTRPKSDFNNHPEAIRLNPASTNPEKTAPSTSSDRLRTGHAALKPAASNNITSSSPNPGVNSTAATSAPIAPVSSQIYRVGIRDVLDIQLVDNPGKSSTLFTVLDGGMLEYPLAGDPIAVAGLTTPEIAALLRSRLRIFDNPTVNVKVRDYASHSVTITGFVAAPGTKVLRREAMPLYAILAESVVLPEAATATITRQGRTLMVVDLKDVKQSSTMIISGDAIKVSGAPAAPTEFFFIGGEINSPGQKSYHAGLTLTQAILASGGTKASAGSKIRVSRQGANGLLTTEEYNLRKIQSGKAADPALVKGDRIEVTNMK
ncbi:MAG TPA: polysaccharide biosynthesis/export family protein [Pyrinomonadaceae bacterium]|jgi:protein involved in polysaccharide export with SLBB domain